MARKKKEEPRREVTKRQLARWQQRNRVQRLIRSLGILVVAAVVGVVGVGWYLGQYRPLHETVIRVNDAEFDMNYYIEMLKLQGRDQPAQYMPYLADIVVRNIERNELIKQGARLLTSIDDIFSELPRLAGNIKSKRMTQSNDLTETEKNIVKLFKDEPIHIDILVRQSEISLPELMPVLLALELKGLIRELSGKRYMLN